MAIFESDSLQIVIIIKIGESSQWLNLRISLTEVEFKSLFHKYKIKIIKPL